MFYSRIVLKIKKQLNGKFSVFYPAVPPSGKLKKYLKRNFNIFKLKEPLFYKVSISILIFSAIVLSSFFVNVSAEEKPLELTGFTEAPIVDSSSLSIIQTSPEGIISSSDLKKEIVVVFSHPMVPLAALQKDVKGLFSINPPVSGKFRWYGSRVLAFVPSSKFSEAAQYSVRIPAGTKSLNGFSLSQDKTFSFKTSEMKLLYVNPGRGSGSIEYRSKFTLTFNYPVALTEVERFVKLISENKTYAFDASYPGITPGMKITGDELLRKKQTVTIIPREDFRRNSGVRLVVSRGLKPLGGNQGLSEAAEYSYKTYGPLTGEFKGSARYFENIYSYRIQFNNPVNINKTLEFIKISPPAKIIRKYNYENTDSIYLTSWDLKPSSSYAITILDGMTDAFGNAYQGQRTFNFQTPRMRKTYSAETGISFIESRMSQKVPVFARGMDNVDVSISMLDTGDIEKFLNGKISFYKDASSSADKNIPWNINQGDNASAQYGYDLSPHLKDGNGWLYVSFSGNVESWDGKINRQSYGQIVQSTDLGLLVKESYEYADVWVHSFSTGKAVAGVQVTSADGGSSTDNCKTDLSGYCRLSKSKNTIKYDNNIYYTARKGNDRTFLTNRNHKLYMGSMSSHFTSIASLPSLAGQIVFDRKLYRPGDPVNIKVFAAVREHGKLSSDQASLGKLKIIISDSRGENIYEDVVSPSDQGGISADIVIPEDAPTGHYTVAVSSVRIEDLRKEINYYLNSSIYETFQIEEFRPVNFSVSSTGMKDSMVGADLPVEIEGKYLFGAPMGDARYSYTVNRKPQNLYISNFSDYLLGDDDYGDIWEPVTWSYFSGGNGKLNKAGRAALKIPLQIFKPQGFDRDILSRMYQIELESSVTDVDDKTVTNRKTISVYPGKFIPGIKVKDRYQNKTKPFEFDFILLSSENKSSVSGQAQIIIHKKIWKTIHVQGPSDSVQRKNTLIRKEVLRKNITVSEAGSKFSFKTPESGNYSITLKETNGKSYSRLNFYSYGNEYIGWDFPDDDSLTLLPDRSEYRPGDTAKILIQSPYKKSTAIVTIEREGVLSQKSYEIIGNGNPIEIPIKDEYVPNIYVGVVLLRPRIGVKNTGQSSDEDLGRPQLKAGVVRLNVDTSSRSIPLKVKSDRKTYEPGSDVMLEIKTVPGAEIALSVADRAVLDLVSYNYGNPLEKFYDNWPHGVQIVENRHALIKQVAYANKGNSPGGKGWDDEKEKGGGFGDDSEDGIRKDFRHTAFWDSMIIADKNGNAVIKFKLPHNLTTFRIQALASHNGKYGVHKSEFQVQKPILIQTVTPRFIRPGDILEIGAVVINQMDQKAKFKVDFSSDYLSILDENKITSKIVEIDAHTSREVSFSAALDEKKYTEQLNKLRSNTSENKSEKDNKSGTAVKGIVAKGIIGVKPLNPGDFSGSGLSAAALTDKVMFTLPVFEQPVSEAFAISGYTENKIEEIIQVPEGNIIAPYIGGLELLVSSTALTGLDSGFKFFRSNPYFCLEQKASAFLLTMTAGELLNSFNFSPPEKGAYNFPETEEIFISGLPDHQNSDGGFRLWKDSTYIKSNPYLTAHVVFVLQNLREANKEHGKRYSFPDSVFNKAVKYLKNYIRRPQKDSLYYSMETLSYIQYILAREGESDIFLERLLIKNIDKLSLRSQSYLALSIAIRKNANTFRTNKILRIIMTNIKNRMVFNTRKIHFNEPVYGSYMRTYYSEGSTLAAVLRVFMLLDSKNPLIPNMVQGIISQNNARFWYDSHSTGNLAYSLWQYHNIYEKSNENFTGKALIGAKNIITHSFKSDEISQFSGSVPMSDLLSMGAASSTLPLSFSLSQGKGRLYYTGLLKYSFKKPAAEARDEGIEIYREIFRAEGTDFADNKEAKLFKRGDVFLVRLRVINPKPVYYFILNDSLASNMEIVNTGFQTENASLSRFLDKKRSGTDGYWWEYADTIYEYRDDRVLIKTDYLSPGIHEYYYISRALVKGTALNPPAQAFGMYEPEIFGRTSSQMHTVQ